MGIGTPGGNSERLRSIMVSHLESLYLGSNNIMPIHLRQLSQTWPRDKERSDEQGWDSGLELMGQRRHVGGER